MHSLALALTVAVFGDAPYGTSPTDNAEFLATPAFIQSINADPDVRWVLHVGDIHSGKHRCTEDYDRSIFDLWKSFEDPLVYTPGDNEWSDCHKPGEGGNVLGPDGNPVDYANGDPIANLALIRRVRSSTVGNKFDSPAASTRSALTILPVAASCSLMLIRIVSPDLT